MKAPKALQMSFRVTKRFRDVLIALADRENRSQANALEVALLAYAANVGLEIPGAKGKAAKKKTAKKD